MESKLEVPENEQKGCLLFIPADLSLRNNQHHLNVTMLEHLHFSLENPIIVA